MKRRHATVDLGTVLRVADGVLYRAVADEAVLLNQTTGQYFGLNDSGTMIWEQIVEHGRGHDVLKPLADRCGVPERRLREDVQALLEDLAAQGLLVAVDEDGADHKGTTVREGPWRGLKVLR